MSKDLKMIKKYYGEDMAHLCRELFSTLLEKEGYLFSLIESKFAHSKSLCQSIVIEDKVNEFKDLIYSLTKPQIILIDNGKSVQELMNEAGYEIFECKSEDDIQSFRHYYAEGEELCTFNGNRLKTCHVFFAVKKNVSEIKRENYFEPKRQDEYGTSVISIQFTRGANNTLSIKNRYNHIVNNPDATFKNNLENIIPGLTKAFERDYGFKIMQNVSNFKLGYYVMASNGKFYEISYEIENICYGPNNVIIDKFELQDQFLDKSRYIVFEYMILDMLEKRLYLYDSANPEKLPEFIGEIKKITVKNMKDYKCKQIKIVNISDEETILYINDKSELIGFVNNSIKEIMDRDFLTSAINLKYIEAENLEVIGNHMLHGGYSLERFIAPRLRKVGRGFLGINECCKHLYCPSLVEAEINFMEKHAENLPQMAEAGDFVVNDDLRLNFSLKREIKKEK